MHYATFMRHNSLETVSFNQFWWSVPLLGTSVGLCWSGMFLLSSWGCLWCFYVLGDGEAYWLWLVSGNSWSPWEVYFLSLWNFLGEWNVYSPLMTTCDLWSSMKNGRFSLREKTHFCNFNPFYFNNTVLHERRFRVRKHLCLTMMMLAIAV